MNLSVSPYSSYSTIDSVYGIRVISPFRLWLAAFSFSIVCFRECFLDPTLSVYSVPCCRCFGVPASFIGSYYSFGASKVRSFSTLCISSCFPSFAWGGDNSSPTMANLPASDLCLLLFLAFFEVRSAS